VAGSPTLRALVSGASLVARARVEEAQGWIVLETPTLRRPAATARLLEVFKGNAEPGASVRFAQHGHGVAEFEVGEEVILFLRPLEGARELAETGLAGALAWVSFQEHDAKYVLTPQSREAIVGAVRAYVALEREQAPAARIAALRRVTLELLASPEPRLAASALRDLVLASEALPLLRAEDLPRLEPLLADASVAIGVRSGLLAALERRGLVEGPPRWVALLRSAAPADRARAIRTAGAHPSPPVTAALVRLLDEEDAVAAAEAAVALGVPGHAAAAAPLAELLARDDVRLRMAAIRGLGGMATPAARAALEEAAASHPDPATRRRARAEVRRLAGRRSETPEQATHEDATP
jgi:hypothetical protein